MSFSAKQRPMDHNVMRLVACGDLDTAAREPLTEAVANVLTADQPCGLILDLNAVSVVDADGVKAIENAHRLAANAGVAFVVVNAHNPTASELLDETGVLTAISRS